MNVLNLWLNFSFSPDKLTVVSIDCFHHRGLGKWTHDSGHWFIKDTACLRMARSSGPLTPSVVPDHTQVCFWWWLIGLDVRDTSGQPVGLGCLWCISPVKNTSLRKMESVSYTRPNFPSFIMVSLSLMLELLSPFWSNSNHSMCLFL